MENLSILVLRIFFGAIFTHFGFLKFTRDREQKIKFFYEANLRPARFFLYLVALPEFLGGILLGLGIFINPIGVIFSILMAGAVFIKIKNKNSLPNAIHFYILLFLVSLFFASTSITFQQNTYMPALFKSNFFHL